MKLPITLVHKYNDIADAEEHIKSEWRELGVLMRRYRKAKLLSLRQLAKLMGCSAPFLSDMELGCRHYTKRWAEKAMEVLK